MTCSKQKVFSDFLFPFPFGAVMAFGSPEVLDHSVVYIDLICTQIVRFSTMDHIGLI